MLEWQTRATLSLGSRCVHEEEDKKQYANFGLIEELFSLYPLSRLHESRPTSLIDLCSKVLESRLEMLEQKMQASEQVNRFNDSTRSQDLTSRMLKLETSVCVAYLHSYGLKEHKEQGQKESAQHHG